MISHLLFVDDTLILCDPEWDQIGYLKCILLCFEAVSGLEIYLSKTEMVPVGVVPGIEELAANWSAEFLLAHEVFGLP